MHSSGWTRAALLAGTVGVVLLVASFFLPGQIHGDESPSEIVSLLVDNRTAVLTGIGLQIASIILFFIFITGLRRVLRRGEKEPASLSTLAFTLGCLGGAVVVVSNAMLAAITAKVAPALQQSDANLVWALAQVYKSVGYSVDLLLGSFALATALLLVRSAAGPRWLGWLGLLPGALWVLATFTIVDPDGMIGLAGMFGGLLFALWSVLLSLFLLPQAGATQPSTRTASQVAATVQG